MASATDQCRALTDDGDRCNRPAQDGEFCYQHDDSDPTIDNGDGSSDDEGTDASTDESEPEGQSTSEGDTDQPDAEAMGDDDIVQTRETVHAIGQDLIGHELDGIVGMARSDEGWQVTVEVIERSAVPDTQDILGQYEIDLDSDQTVTGYRRIDRYRRGDTQREDYIG